MKMKIKIYIKDEFLQDFTEGKSVRFSSEYKLGYSLIKCKLSEIAFVNYNTTYSTVAKVKLAMAIKEEEVKGKSDATRISKAVIKLPTTLESVRKNIIEAMSNNDTIYIYDSFTDTRVIASLIERSNTSFYCCFAVNEFINHDARFTLEAFATMQDMKTIELCINTKVY